MFFNWLFVFAALMGQVHVADSSAQVTPPRTKSVRVAVFCEPGFPAYGVSDGISSIQIARNLKAARIEVDLLDTDGLADPARLNAKTYSAVVLPYGNTYPVEAFANLRRFHQNRGSLITTGIPFTHPTGRITVVGWTSNPRWGHSVQLIPNAGSQPRTNAISIEAESADWTGVSSPRFSVDTMQLVSASASFRDVGNQDASASNDTQDALYVRFFDKGGNFLDQTSTSVGQPGNTWNSVAVSSTVPVGARFADLSVQIRQPGRRILVSDFAARVDDRPIPKEILDLNRRGDTFIDLGHQNEPALWGKQGIGIGGFAGPTDPTVPVVSPGDPWHLKSLFVPRPIANADTGTQWLLPASLPVGVRLVPALGTPDRPLMALVIQDSGPFRGSIDAWTYRSPTGERDDYYSCQVVARATVAVLARQGLLTPTATSRAFQKLAATDRPTMYRNHTLPTVPRKYATFQPKMPGLSRHLLVANIRTLTDNEKILLLTLQGIVNRKQPRIYFLTDEDDERWLKVLQQQNETDTPVTVADPWKLVDRFRDEFKGAVVCDPNVYVSPCVAVSLAGAENLVVAMTADLARKHGIPIRQDLRGRFKDNAGALQYLRQKLMPHLDPYLTCSLDPAVFAQGALDSIVAARSSVFWITGPDAQNLPGADSFYEVNEVTKLLAGMPLGAVVRGFWWHGDRIGLQEGDGVTLGSRLGKVTLVSDLITNLSVQSGVPTKTLRQRKHSLAPALDPSKTYVAFTMSDGDNLCTWRGYFRRYFEDPARGTIPVGWGMSPAILDLAPSWARWYYENATPNDEFICDVSGIAYMYPSAWGSALSGREKAFQWFYSRTQEYMGKMDMDTIRLMDVGASDIARVGPLLPKVDYLMPDYGHAGAEKYPDLTFTLPITGQAVFRAVTSGSGPEHLADQIRTRTRGNHPSFVNAFIWNWGSRLSDLKRTMEILGPDYIAVTPSQLYALYRKSVAAHPTARTAALRLSTSGGSPRDSKAD